ncbi:MAG: YlmH/Sll1252 family protein, partial [Cellulosilyticaceae bacterium]
MIKIDWEKIQQPEERQFLKLLVEYEQKFERQNRSLYTDFYNCGWIKDVLVRAIGYSTVPGLVLYGGYEDSERVVAGFEDEYVYGEVPVKALRIQVKTGMGKPLSHRDYLGALLGLGIQRSKVGDLIVDAEGAYVIVKQPLDEFIQWNLTGIGRYGQLEVMPIEIGEIELPKLVTKTIRGTVASCRADSVFALVFGLSRTSVAKLLQNEKG